MQDAARRAVREYVARGEHRARVTAAADRVTAAHAEALERLKSLGYMQAPVVVTDQDHWSGFRPDKIEELALSAVSSVA